MSDEFVNALRGESNWKLTENGADALRSTNSDLLDLFAILGALRTRGEDDIVINFSKAFAEDRLLATKMAFYARNIRGGLGERRTARVIWRWLAVFQPEVMRKNLALVPQFGRWDDLYVFVGTPIEEDMWSFLVAQLQNDVRAMRRGEENISLLAKWLKSVNSSSKETRALGRLTAKKLGLSERSYRKLLSALRDKIDVVERKMASKRWLDITYSHVPSRAMKNYRSAFRKHDPSGFDIYMSNVESGVEKIHSGTLYPYDIVEKMMYGGIAVDEVLEEQWKALPNYVEGENNILIVADVSGSMIGRPMATSVGLAVYFAERNKGIFHNKFMTFSENPHFVELKGSTLTEKVHNAMRADWGMNTNIEAALDLILRTATSNNLAQSDLPKSLIIISDMEFDRCATSSRRTFYQHMSAKYQQFGYELPRIVFWNVEARQNTVHAQAENGVQFASGQATSVFKSLIANAEFGAFELMVATLNDPMYDVVKI